MSYRRRYLYCLVAQCGTIALMCSACCTKAAESEAKNPVSATKALVSDERVAEPLRTKTEAPCLRLEIADLEETKCGRQGLCLQVAIRSVDCFEGMWVNTTPSFAVPGKVDGQFRLDVSDADSGAPAHVSCLIHPSVYEPTPEYVQFQGDTVVQHTISESCYKMPKTKSWRVVAHYKDNCHVPVTYEPMRNWFSGELASNEILIPAQREKTLMP